MLDQRETKVINTPVDNHSIVLKAWITAREKRFISSIFVDSSTFNAETKKFDISADTILKIQDAQLSTIVVSVDGDTENVMDKCLDLKAEDFDFVTKEVEKIVNPEVEKK